MPYTATWSGQGYYHKHLLIHGMSYTASRVMVVEFVVVRAVFKLMMLGGVGRVGSVDGEGGS